MHAPRVPRHLLLFIAVVLAVTASLPSTTFAGAGEPDLASSAVQTGLNVPWDIGFTPDGRMLVTIRSGQVRIYANGNAGAPLVRTLAIGSVYAQNEAGVMGIAVDPSFTQSKYFEFDPTLAGPHFLQIPMDAQGVTFRRA